MIGKIQKLKNKKGFTLVELIVVIAIIAVLTAVIVPLVGRYAAQATYTTLQDAAKTVSNTSNTVLAEITQTGDVVKEATIFGEKSGSTLTIKDKTGSSGNTSTLEKKLQSALEEAVPAGAKFVITVKDSTVASVIYSVKAQITAATNGVDKVGDEQYEFGGNPVGIYGTVNVTDKTTST